MSPLFLFIFFFFSSSLLLKMGLGPERDNNIWAERAAGRGRGHPHCPRPARRRDEPRGNKEVRTRSGRRGKQGNVTRGDAPSCGAGNRPLPPHPARPTRSPRPGLALAHAWEPLPTSRSCVSGNLINSPLALKGTPVASESTQLTVDGGRGRTDGRRLQ